jgi:hypothetical protein
MLFSFPGGDEEADALDTRGERHLGVGQDPELTRENLMLPHSLGSCHQIRPSLAIRVHEASGQGMDFTESCRERADRRLWPDDQMPALDPKGERLGLKGVESLYDRLGIR